MNRLSTRLLLSPENLSPSDERFEVVGVFNPGAVFWADEVILLVRVAERPVEHRNGLVGLPRWEVGNGTTIDWVGSDEVEQVDSRVVRLLSSGRLRLTSLSSLRVVYCGDGRTAREISPVSLRHECMLEEYGIEDPRITPLGGRCYITYVAVSRHGPATALASTNDFQTFTRHGVIFCPENKDVVLFPVPIGGPFVALTRPVCGSPFTSPEIWMADSPDLLHWGHHRPLELDLYGVPGSVVGGGQKTGNINKTWSQDRVGAGTPPIQTEEGWLEIYHGASRANIPGTVGSYTAGCLLLDLEEPSHVLRCSQGPILIPETPHECFGFVPKVIFPTGIVEQGDSLLVYLGASDTHTELIELRRSEVEAFLVPAQQSKGF